MYTDDFNLYYLGDLMIFNFFQRMDLQIVRRTDEPTNLSLEAPRPELKNYPKIRSKNCSNLDLLISH